MAKKSPNDVKMGGASVTIGGDDSLFTRVVTAAEKRLKLFAKSAQEIGSKLAVGGGGFVGAAAAIATSFMDVASTAGSMASKIGLSGDDVRAAMQMKGAYLELWRAITEVKNALGAALAPAFTAVYRAIAPMLKSVAALIKANPGLVRVFAIGAGLALAFGTALVAVGAAITTLLPAVAAIVAALAFFITPLGGTLAFFAGALFYFRKAIVAFITSLGAWGAAIKSTFAAVIKYVNAMATGIADALMGGDAMLAIEIFWKGFQLAGLKAIRSISDAFKNALGSFYVNLGGNSLLGITDAQLKAREKELQDLINKAKQLSPSQQQQAVNIPTTMANVSVSANVMSSSGAASTIAKSFNTIGTLTIAQKQLIAQQKTNLLLQQVLQKPPIAVKKVGGP